MCSYFHTSRTFKTWKIFLNLQLCENYEVILNFFSIFTNVQNFGF